MLAKIKDIKLIGLVFNCTILYKSAIVSSVAEKIILSSHKKTLTDYVGPWLDPEADRTTHLPFSNSTRAEDIDEGIKSMKTNKTSGPNSIPTKICRKANNISIIL